VSLQRWKHFSNEQDIPKWNCQLEEYLWNCRRTYPGQHACENAKHITLLAPPHPTAPHPPKCAKKWAVYAPWANYQRVYVYEILWSPWNSWLYNYRFTAVLSTMNAYKLSWRCWLSSCVYDFMCHDSGVEVNAHFPQLDAPYSVAQPSHFDGTVWCKSKTQFLLLTPPSIDRSHFLWLPLGDIAMENHH